MACLCCEVGMERRGDTLFIETRQASESVQAMLQPDYQRSHDAPRLGRAVLGDGRIDHDA